MLKKPKTKWVTQDAAEELLKVFRNLYSCSKREEKTGFCFIFILTLIYPQHYLGQS